MNALTIITDALIAAGVLDPDETPNSAEAETCRRRLNRMLDYWSVNRRAVFVRTEDTKTLTVGDGDYSIGENGTPDISTARPIRIEEAYLRDTTNNFDSLLEVINQPDYNAIPIKNQQAQPGKLYYHPATPNGSIYFDYLPDQAYELHLFSWKPFTAFADLTTEYDFPPGYEAALMANLTVRLAADYKMKVTEMMAAEAVETLDAVKTANMEIPKLSCMLTPGAGQQGGGTILSM